MSEEIKVKLGKDDGYKRRWGLTKILYRQEGRKISINAKVTAWTLSIFIVAASAYSVLAEFFKPAPSESNGPIAFNEQVSDQNTIQVPRGNSETEKPKSTKARLKAATSYSGLQVIQRPNFGKIPPGTMIKAKFMTGASNGPLKASLLEALTVNSEEIAPEGSILVGNGSSGDDRLTVQFTKLVFSDGRSQNIQAQACELSDQTVGVKGKKISKYAMLLAAGAGLNFLSGVAEGLQETQVQNGVTTKKSDLKNAALNGASKAALDQSQEVLSELRNKKSIVQVDNGKEFYVLFEGD